MNTQLVTNRDIGIVGNIQRLRIGQNIGNRENEDHRECREYFENREIVKIGKESRERRESTQE